MSIRKKTMLMMFVDYVLSILIQLIGLLIFSWMLKFSWGYVVYSVIFSMVLFGMLYSRTHNAANRALKRKELKPATEGLLMATPLAVLHLLIILFFALVKSNILPIGDLVMDTIYSFPDNEPRVVNNILFMDNLTMVVRIWFGSLVGFAKEQTPVFLLLVTPAITLLAGYLGYLAGGKKFYLTDVIYQVQEKVKDKFNE